MDLTPLRPDEATRRRVLGATMGAIREAEEPGPTRPVWTDLLELPARHVRWLVPAAAVLWVLAWLGPLAGGAPPTAPARSTVAGAPTAPALLTAAWGVSLPDDLRSEPPLVLLARYAERAP